MERLRPKLMRVTPNRLRRSSFEAVSESGLASVENSRRASFKRSAIRCNSLSSCSSGK